MDELFRVPAGTTSLVLQDERELIIAAQHDSGDAVWMLLVQYRGLLQKVAYDVRKRIAKMTDEQIEDLESALVLAGVEAIKSFDLNRFVRLSQVLPGKLRDVALEMTTALTVPRGTLDRWFKVWRAAGGDFDEGARLAPNMGMTANTFRTIAHALEYTGSEWVHVPHDGGYAPTADDETYRIAHQALSFLTPDELEVIELAYGFRGDPKSDQEVANIVERPRTTISKRRERAVIKMRTGMTE